LATPELQILSDTIRGLLEAADQLQNDAPPKSQLQSIISRGEFRPAEDEAIGFWFARFLTVRESLWVVIEDVLAVIEKPTPAVEEQSDLRYFLLGYAAVCILVRIDRLMLFEVAHHSIIQRKLNEAFPEYRIPRKQYTSIFSSLVDQKNVLAIRDAMKFAKKNRRKLLQLSTDARVGFIASQLRELEASLNPSKLSHLKRAWSFVSHKWRRRGVVSASTILASVMEAVGRTASEFYEANNKSVSAEVLSEIGDFLQPGDVIVTRQAKALTNLFIPGFWPHSALYIGTAEQRKAAEIDIGPRIEQLWVGDICVLEARKDGVLLRPLSDTLSVDVFVVLRPNLNPGSIREAIGRAMLHQGKMYNFDFDFFNSDRIVCTELIYRSYDGLEGLQIPLSERAGRKTLTAEELLNFALDAKAFTPVAIFGVEGCEGEIAYGDGVRTLLERTYERPVPSAGEPE
jgi:hypothetical protein